MKKNFIITNEDLETYGIIGIVKNPVGYEDGVFQMEITDLDGNEQTNYSIGDTFDIIGGDFKRYYPPDTPESVMLRERLEILENKLKSRSDMDEDRSNHFDYIEQVEMPRLLKEIEKEEEKERLEKEERLKEKTVKEEINQPFTKENLKKMLTELFQNEEVSISSCIAEKQSERYIEVSVQIDGKEIYTDETYIGRIEK